jgi:hypothetical protein
MTATPRARAVDPADEVARIDRAGGGEGRAVPYHCPFCAEEDLRPHPGGQGAWHCRSCLRVFAVRFLGLATPDWPDAAESLAPPDAGPAGPTTTHPTPDWEARR